MGTTFDDGKRTDGRQRKHWTRKSLSVARTHVRRVRRQQVNSTWKLLLMIVAGLVMTLFVGGFALLAAGIGEALASGELEGIGGQLPTIRGVAATAWLGITGTIALRAAGARGNREVTGGLLWAVPTRPIAVGIALAEVGFLLLWIEIPLLVVTAGFAYGVGSPLPLVTVAVAGLVVAVLGTAVGYPLGLAIRHVLTRFPTIKRHRTALSVLLALGYVVAVSSEQFNQVVASLIEPLSATPPGWVADIALLGVPQFEASTAHAAVGLGQLVVVWPAVIAITWVANRHWFADSVLGDDRREQAPPTGDRAADAGAGAATDHAGVVGSRSRVEQWLTHVTNRQTAALVLIAYRRALRAPAKLLYAALPFFFIVPALPDMVAGQVPTYIPGSLLWMVTWAAGVGFVLNPLGDQGSVLPATILSGVSGARFVRAHVLATLLVVLPVGIVVTGTAAVASPMRSRDVALLVAASPVVVLAGSMVGVGIGMAAPRFSSVKVSGSTRAVVPSKLAFMGYTVYLIAAVLAGWLVLQEGPRVLMAAVVEFLLALTGASVAIQPETVRLVAGAVLVVALAVPIACYRYAVSRFGTVTLESAGA